MRIGVCGITCEKCPKMTRKQCPDGDRGCDQKKHVLQDCNLCLRE